MKRFEFFSSLQQPARFLWTLAVLAVALSTANTSFAAGLLTPGDGRLPTLQIKRHDVNVVIEDGYAATEVEQVFHNPHGQDLEAIYSFPIPDKAAVAEFTLWIDGQPVSAEVMEKSQAKQVYEQEKAAGRETGLTNKNAYKTFEISVSPVRAGQDTRIRLVYLQAVHMDTGIGRYLYPLEEGGVDEQQLAFWTANDKVMQAFSFKLLLKSSYPIEAVRMPNQPSASVQKNTDGSWILTLDSRANTLEQGQPAAGTPAAFRLDQDMLVYWRHQQGLSGTVDLVTYKAKNASRGSFMLTLTPGDDLKPLTQGSDWIFVLDTSGSMQGKYATLADGVQRAMAKLRIDDRFRIIAFNKRARELTPGYVNATADNIQHYSAEVTRIQPGEGTNLYSGVARALRSIDADRTTAIVLVTDGVANVGEVKQRKFLELLNNKDIRLFTFIMGNSANRPLLEAMTKASNGFALNISNSDDIVGKILQASNKVTHEALHGVELAISGVKTGDLTPKTIGSLYRGQQLVVFGHYFGDGTAELTLSGRISGREKSYRTQIKFPANNEYNPEIERLWAYAAIEELMEDIHNFGEKADIKQAVTETALEYGLVTDYTSMLIVRDEMFDAYGIKRTNQQRSNNERNARQLRANRPIVSHRADTNKPMFAQPRPGYKDASGALDLWLLVLLAPLVWFRNYSTRQWHREVPT